MAAGGTDTVAVDGQFKVWLEHLCEGHHLSASEAEQAVSLIAEGKGELSTRVTRISCGTLQPNTVNECQIAAFVALLHRNGETADEVAGTCAVVVNSAPRQTLVHHCVQAL